MKLVVYFFICCCMLSLQAQQKAVVGFYNLENLYDTLDDPLKLDDDFTPQGSLQFTGERYRLKIQHLAKCISDMGKEVGAEGPDILGVCEVENKAVLLDLCSDSSLKKSAYQVVLLEGSDARGVDPGLIYKPERFTNVQAKAFPIKLPHDSLHKTRDVLLVTGELVGERIAIFVNHWPSRRGGELRSRGGRNAAARRLRYLADSVEAAEEGIKILIMGDFNDDPINESIKKYIGTYAKLERPIARFYFNPMEHLYKKGNGTLAYKDSWSLFDQILLNQNFFNSDDTSWTYVGVKIHSPYYTRSDYGNFKGYPFRTYSGGIFSGGYSDHFAVWLVFEKKTKVGLQEEP